MSKKHFVKLAAILNNYYRLDYVHGSQELIYDIAKDIAAMCRAENSQFDTDRFLQAVVK